MSSYMYSSDKDCNDSSEMVDSKAHMPEQVWCEECKWGCLYFFKSNWNWCNSSLMKACRLKHTCWHSFLFQLLARIERMERRMQLVKKDNEREKHRIFQGYETEEKAESEASEKLQIECQQDLLETSQPLPPKHFSYGRNGKGHKRYRTTSWPYSS